MSLNPMSEFRGSRAATWLAILAVVVVGVGVVVLSVMAFDRANPDTPPGSAAPVPTFTLGVQTQTPTPEPEPERPAFDRPAERFLATATGTLWRATAGSCPGIEPLIERSNDDGASWTDVTPRYLGIGQVGSLDGLAVDAAEAIAAMGGGCEPQALRSYTNGEFWASYPDVLALSRYVDFADPAVVQMPGGAVAAPCEVAHGLRALRERVTLVCDGAAFVWRDAAWTALPGEGAVAVAIAGTDVVTAHVTVECAGLTLTRFADGDPEAGSPAGCAEGTDAAAPAAIVVAGSRILVWSGDSLVSVG